MFEAAHNTPLCTGNAWNFLRPTSHVPRPTSHVLSSVTYLGDYPILSTLLRGPTHFMTQSQWYQTQFSLLFSFFLPYLTLSPARILGMSAWHYTTLHYTTYTLYRFIQSGFASLHLIESPWLDSIDHNTSHARASVMSCRDHHFLLCWLCCAMLCCVHKIPW